MNIRCFPLSCNCYVVSDDDGNAVIIDPCEHGRELYSYVETQNLKLCAVIITHAHFDHIYGLTHLIDEARENGYSIPVHIHTGDAPAMSDSDKNLSAPLFRKPYTYTGTLNELRDGDTVSVGTMTFKVMSCPGHTPGSALYIEESQKTIFAGDVIFDGSIGRTDFPGGDMGEMRKSLEKIMELDDDYKIYSGHGGSTTVGDERNFNPYIANL